PALPSPCYLHVLTFAYIFSFSIEPAPPSTYTLSLHDALPISASDAGRCARLRRSSTLFRHFRFAARFLAFLPRPRQASLSGVPRSEEHTSELQSLRHLVCRLLLEKKKCMESCIMPAYRCTTLV